MSDFTIGLKSTIKDVARESGVSIATVTRVLQSSPLVRPQTKRRVEAAIDRLGYRPNLAARALVMRETKTLGLMIPTSADPYWGEVATGVETRARRDGYSVLLGHTERDHKLELDLFELFMSKRIEGLIVGGASQHSYTWLREAQKEIRIALIGWDATTKASDLISATGNQWPNGALVEDPDTLLNQPEDQCTPEVEGPVFIADDCIAAAEMVSYLLRLGHKKIVFMGGRLLMPSLRMLRGIRSVFEVEKAWPCKVWHSPETFDAGRKAAIALLGSRNPPTALFAYNDVLAIGAMRGARELGLRVPDDVSVVGFDDIEAAAFVEPPLTTVRTPKYEFGVLAVEALLATISGSKSGNGQPRTELVLRASSRAPGLQP